jgi:uncharacterized protein with von Willebrand factor type A (vWA) domain
LSLEIAMSLVVHLIRFGRHLRAGGVVVTPERSADLLRAASLVGWQDREDLYLALRAVSLSRPEERPLFDEAFEQYFVRRVAPPAPAGGDSSQMERFLRLLPAQAGPVRETQTLERTGWSSTERLARRDFGDLSAEELAQVRRLIARMNWERVLARSRRFTPAPRGRPDLRRTLRRRVKQEGPLVPLVYAAPRPRQRPLVVLADVSGSMERYTEMLLCFVHAARRWLGRLEAFVFATRLTRVTREMGGASATGALARVAESVQDWSGGTRIGESVGTFNRRWSRHVLRGRPVALVISDGWDRGDPELLREEMARFSRGVHRLLWLNPLAGHEDYQPEVRGMRTVLPYVDQLLPAASLADLAKVVRLLESTS